MERTPHIAEVCLIGDKLAVLVHLLVIEVKRVLGFRVDVREYPVEGGQMRRFYKVREVVDAEQAVVGSTGQLLAGGQGLLSATVKGLLEDDKVQVQESLYRPMGREREPKGPGRLAAVAGMPLAGWR